MGNANEGGGGLVQQLRRSYSLSDLSSDKDSMSDVNRNSKALSNIPDDDMMEETDGTTDPRLLRPRGYSPRRSASGSGRVEMYFPEVDVDVRQHGSRPREPSIPLSHIRSSEDVSSGYSSAEPLYAGHHQTKAESLATSREPLVRTASMGSTRSMRTKSSRGGIVTKRPPVAEDSEPWDGEEAEFQNQEENFYNVSSSQPSQSAPIPISERPITIQTAQPELLLLLQQLNEGNSTQVFTIETQSYEELSTKNIKPTESIDNRNIPLENDNDDVVDDTEFYVDVIESFVDANILPQESTRNQSSSHIKVESLTDTTQVSDDTFQETDLESDASVPTEPPQTSLEPEGRLISPTEITPDAHLSPVEQSCSCPPLTLTSSETGVSLYPTEGAPSTAEKNVEVQTSNNLSSTNFLIETVFEPVKQHHSANSKEDGFNNTEPLPVPECSIGSSETSDTTFVINTTLDTDKVDTTFSGLEDDFTLNDIKTFEELKTDDDIADISINSDETIVSNTLLEDEMTTMMLSEQSPTDVSSLEYVHTTSLDEATADLPISRESVESLVSDKIQTDKKDARSGRYHKRPAPSPPVKMTDSEPCKNCTRDDEVILATVEHKPCDNFSVTTCDTKDVSSQQSSDPQELSNTQTAVKARLVLKPGIVRSLGPETQGGALSKSEKFVSTSPKTKQKNTRSRTPGKYRESSFSRLLLMPKNQLGHFASLFPFWHSRGEPSSSTIQSAGEASAGSNVSQESDVDPMAKELTQGSLIPTESTSCLPVVPAHKRIMPMSSCSLEYLPFVGSVTDYIDQQRSSHNLSSGGTISRAKSSSISDFKIRDMSHSPPMMRRQAPEN